MYESPYNFSYTEDNKGRTSIIYAEETTRDQKTPFENPGLTIVSFVRAADSYPLKSACVRLREARPSLHGFAPMLHLTVLGILGRYQPKLKDKQRELIREAVCEVMNNKLARMPQFAVTGEGIRSGGDVKRIGGNVVAAIKLEDRQHIEELSGQLVKQLEPRLTKIHPEIRLRPAKGIKITIGYYDEPEDFGIDRDLALALEELRHVKINLWVERIALVRFHFKSLEDGETMYDIPLKPPASQPIRKVTARPKVLAMPNWTRWCGVSYLFDNPGASLARLASTGLLQVACKPWSDPELPLYRSLGDALAEVGLHSADNPWSFCPLPSISYHVTVWDGINDGNLHKIAEPERKEFAEFLLHLPQSAKFSPPNLIPADAFDGLVVIDPVVIDPVVTGPVKFQFEGLSLRWRDSVLVAKLAPVGEKSKELLAAIRGRRKHLDERLAKIGRPASLRYTPHVSLGYFCDPGGARLARKYLPQWAKVFRCQAGRCEQAFPSIGAYAFESMMQFIKLNPTEKQLLATLRGEMRAKAVTSWELYRKYHIPPSTQ